MKHTLKIEPKYAERIVSGEKKFEVRLNDRDYQKHDIIVLHPNYKAGDEPKYKCITADIEYIHSGYGLQENFVVLGLKNIGWQEV
jgi:hypothetical protein